MSIAVKKIETNGFETEYFSFGSGKKPLVILPGLSVQSVMGSANIIANAYSCFADDYTVYVLDRRSSLPDTYTVCDMADDTAEVFCSLDIGGACVFGASQGGMIALVLAARYPELVKKLALGSSSARITEKQRKTLTYWAQLAKDKKRVKLSVEMGRDLYPESVFLQYENALKRMGESITDGELERFVVLSDGTKDFDITSELKNIKCPVLSIGAADDAVLPGAAEELAELMKDRADFESYMYKDYGHAAFDTAPDYKERLLTFFE